MKSYSDSPWAESIIFRLTQRRRSARVSVSLLLPGAHPSKQGVSGTAGRHQSRSAEKGLVKMSLDATAAALELRGVDPLKKLVLIILSESFSPDEGIVGGAIARGYKVSCLSQADWLSIIQSMFDAGWIVPTGRIERGQRMFDIVVLHPPRQPVASDHRAKGVTVQ